MINVPVVAVQIGAQPEPELTRALGVVPPLVAIAAGHIDEHAHSGQARALSRHVGQVAIVPGHVEEQPQRPGRRRGGRTNQDISGAYSSPRPRLFL